MLNYVVALVLEYLIFDSHSYLRDTSGFEASVFPQGKMLPDEATWPSWTVHSLVLPLGFLVAIGVAVIVWVLYTRTRFGFEVQVIARLPARGSLRRNADAPKDPGRHVPLRCDRRDRGSESGRRLSPSTRSAWATSGELRVHGHRRRSTCAVQPVGGRARGIAARWVAERGLRAAGRGLPERPRRRDAGPDPLLRSRRRAVRPLPRAVRARASTAKTPAPEPAP